MSAALVAEPWVCMVDGKPLTSADLRSGPVKPAPGPTEPAPTAGIRLVVAAVAKLGEANRAAIVRKSGLSATTVAILLPSAIDAGVLARVRGPSGGFVYRAGRSK